MSGGLIPNLDTGSIPVSSITDNNIPIHLYIKVDLFFDLLLKLNSPNNRETTDFCTKPSNDYSVIFTKKIKYRLWQGLNSRLVIGISNSGCQYF